jgi:hypothetical protein
MTAMMGGMQDQPMEEAGRGGDTDMGHLTPGEVVLPVEIVSARGTVKKLTEMFEKAGLDIDEYTVGNEKNKMNPDTGYPEFFSLSKMFTGKSRSQRKRDAENKIERQQQARLDAQYNRMMAAITEQKADLEAKSRLEKAKFRADAIKSQLDFKDKLKTYKADKLQVGVKAVGMSAEVSDKDDLPNQKRKFARRRDMARKISSYNARRPM